jgi:hypothetical protein
MADPVQYLIHPAFRARLDAWLASQGMRVDRMPESEQREDQLDLYLVAPDIEPDDWPTPAGNTISVKVEGVEYTAEAVESVRLALIEVRNAALDQQSFEIAVALSHAIVYLSHYRDELRAPRT